MENIDFLPIFYILILIIISGMLSGSETSITSVNKSKIYKLANKGDRKAKRLLHLIKNKNDLIGSILVGNNIVNILASVLATAILINYFGRYKYLCLPPFPFLTIPLLFIKSRSLILRKLNSLTLKPVAYKIFKIS